MKFLILLFLSFSILFGGAMDINRASKIELLKLHGIGEKRANAILDYRHKHKCFKNVEELKNVKGIGEKFMQKNKKNISAKGCNK